MPKTNYLEGEIIKHVFRSGSFTKPGGLWIALFTADPTETGSLADEVSTSSTAYARASVPPDDANWSAPAGGNGQTDNVDDINFVAPSDDWGQITHFGICDAASSGNVLYYEALNSPKTVNNGDPAPKFSAGNLTVAED